MRAGDTASNVVGVETEPHGPVVGDGLADLRGHALQELVGVGRPGGDPLDGVDDTRQQPARPWQLTVRLRPDRGPPFLGGSRRVGPTPLGVPRCHDSARPRDRQPAPRGASSANNQPRQGADHERHPDPHHRPREGGARHLPDPQPGRRRARHLRAGELAGDPRRGADHRRHRRPGAPRALARAWCSASSTPTTSAGSSSPTRTATTPARSTRCSRRRPRRRSS